MDIKQRLFNEMEARYLDGETENYTDYQGYSSSRGKFDKSIVEEIEVEGERRYATDCCIESERHKPNLW